MFNSKIVLEKFKNKRLDVILLEMKLVKSRQRATSLIMSGNIYIDNQKIDKPGKIIKKNQIIRIKENDNPWVSRGGIKLSKAINNFSVIIKNKVCLDIGCSTGGFSHVLLKNNAKKIFAVDVGYGQLDWKLRNDPKINLLERTNAKYLNSKQITEQIDLMVCDVSFISLKKVILPCKLFLKKSFEIIALVKPQFEVQKKFIGRGGIVRDSNIHKEICDSITQWFENEFKPDLIDLIESPIHGQKGNKEFFIYVKKISSKVC